MARILVAEDDGDMCRLLQIRLERAGHDVIVTRNGLEALAGIRRELPDLAVIDWMMPGMDGIELALTVRQDEHAGGTRLLMLTARSRPEDEDRARSAGVTSFMTKPFRSQELLSRVDELLEIGAAAPDPESD